MPETITSGRGFMPAFNYGLEPSGSSVTIEYLKTEANALKSKSEAVRLVWKRPATRPTGRANR
jgi:hypothetical protein